MRISDWSSDVCSSDLVGAQAHTGGQQIAHGHCAGAPACVTVCDLDTILDHVAGHRDLRRGRLAQDKRHDGLVDRDVDANGRRAVEREDIAKAGAANPERLATVGARSDEHRLGKEVFNTSRLRWSSYPQTNKT